jgi:hypothetical protein
MAYSTWSAGLRAAAFTPISALFCASFGSGPSANSGIPHRCLVSSNVQGYFEELIDDAQEAILSMLGQRTLLQAHTELEIREIANGPPAKFGYR